MLINNNMSISELKYINLFNIKDEHIIVLIDDDKNIVNLILEYFKHSLDQRVIFSTHFTLLSGLNFIIEHYNIINLIICDYHLDSNKRGIEIASILKQRGIYIPFILISAGLELSELKELKKVGITLYIDKTDQNFFNKLINFANVFFL